MVDLFVELGFDWIGVYFVLVFNWICLVMILGFVEKRFSFCDKVCVFMVIELGFLCLELGV